MNLLALFNNKKGLMRMFKRKQGNKRVMWASIISIALSTLAMFMRRGQKKITAPSVGNFMDNLKANRNIPAMSDAALTEFSEELITKAIQDK